MNTNTFDQALKYLFEIEGLISDQKNDRGGLTKYGISKKSYPDLDIANLTQSEAKEIYFTDYWLAAKCDQLPDQFAIAVFGSAANHSVSRAIKLLQVTLRVTNDGIIGPQTLAAAKTQNNRYMLGRFLSFRSRYYFDIVYKDQTQYRWVRGWLRRLFVLQQFILEVTNVP